MITIHDIIQRSPEWFAIRKGKLTASQMSSVMTPTGKTSSSAPGFMRKLARELVIDDPTPPFDNFAMKWGRENEASALAEFENAMDLEVRGVGFITNDSLKHVGVSPDGWLPELDGGWEVKNPSVDKHVEYLLAGELPKEYRLQIHMSIYVCEADFWYFQSSFPGLKPFILKVERDDFTDKVGGVIDAFDSEFDLIKDNIIEAISLPEVDEEVGF